MPKEIFSAKLMKQIMQQYYSEFEKTRQKIAWCTSVGPAELLLAIGFKVYFPENHGAILGVIRKASDYIPLANSIGYSPDICSYLTSDIGAYLKKETGLTTYYGLKNIPKPDVLVYSTNQCREMMEWFNFYAKEFNVPSIGIKAPKYLGNVEEIFIEDVEQQLISLIPILEKISGEKFEEEKLKEIILLSKKATILWKEVLETAMNIPSPLTFFDGCIHMAPIVVLRGQKIAIDYYKILKEEIEERVKNKISAIENEKFRLYWDGMPIWGKLRNLAEQFEALNANVVASTYCNSWIFDDFDDFVPLYSMAKAYLKLFINRDENAKEEYIEEMVKKFSIDGIIFHEAKTCPYNTNTRFAFPQRVQKKLGIPCLIIYGDLNDLRCYSEEQAKTNIQAFIEGLEQ